ASRSSIKAGNAIASCHWPCSLVSISGNQTLWASPACIEDYSFGPFDTILVLARGSSSHEIGFLSAGTGRFTMRPIPPVIVEDLSAGNPRLAHGGRVQGIGLTHHQFYSPSRERSRNTRRPGRTYQEAIRLRS